jgi:hypothetical protein
MPYGPWINFMVMEFGGHCEPDDRPVLSLAPQKLMLKLRRYPRVIFSQKMKMPAEDQGLGTESDKLCKLFNLACLSA